MLVPAVCVRVLLDGGLRLEGLEGLDIGLGRSVALRAVSLCCHVPVQAPEGRTRSRKIRGATSALVL